MVKIAQSFAFGRKKANQGGLRGFTIVFFQQSLDSWRAFVIFVQFILKTVGPHVPWSQRFFLIFLCERDQEQAAKRRQGVAKATRREREKPLVTLASNLTFMQTTGSGSDPQALIGCYFFKHANQFDWLV